MNKKWLILLFFFIMAIFSAKVSVSGIRKIIGEEGLRLKPYQDEGGKWTIGYGHLIQPHEQYLLNPAGITDQEARKILANDLETADKIITEKVKIPLTQNQRDALVSFVFNVGSGNFSQSTLLKLVNESKIKDAANEFDRWIFVEGKISNVLKTRREREKNLFLSV